MDNPSFWAVLPASVRYDPKLTPNAKLLYAEITALMDKKGYCFATNNYFMERFKLSDRSITGLISQLRDKGYINVEVVNEGGRNERRITADRVAVLDDHPAKNCGVHPAKNCGDHPAKNCGHININNISIPPKAPQGGRRVPSHKETADHEPERFEKLWKFYPHSYRGNRQRAIAAWDRLSPSSELIDTIARALMIQLRGAEWSRGIGIPHLSTYLNQSGWEGAEDEEDESSLDTGTTWAPDPELRGRVNAV